MIIYKISVEIASNEITSLKNILHICANTSIVNSECNSIPMRIHCLDNPFSSVFHTARFYSIAIFFPHVLAQALRNTFEGHVFLILVLIVSSMNTCVCIIIQFISDDSTRCYEIGGTSHHDFWAKFACIVTFVCDIVIFFLILFIQKYSNFIFEGR